MEIESTIRMAIGYLVEGIKFTMAMAALLVIVFNFFPFVWRIYVAFSKSRKLSSR